MTTKDAPNATLVPDGPPCETSVPPVSSLRWIMIGLAFFATLLNYLDRQALSVVAPGLCKEFRMSDETYGLVVSAFMLAYTIMNGVSGPLLDRLGTRVGYALSIGWWSTASLLHAFARGPYLLGCCRFLLGMGEAANWPAAVKLVAEWFPRHERSFASGIFNSGAAVGAIAAPPFVAWLVLSWGWPAAFMVVGVLGYLWLIVWWHVYFTPAAVETGAQGPPPSWKRLLRTRFLVFFTLSKVFIDPVWYFYIFWFPKYLGSVHGLDIREIGATAWIPFLTADFGNLTGGWITGILIRRGVTPSHARKAMVAASALLMTAAIPVAFATNARTAIALVSVATFGYTSYSANALAFPADVFPPKCVGAIWGLASMGSGFGGMIFSWLSGSIIDRFGYLPVFVGYGVMPLIALAIVLILLGPLRPDPRFS